MGALDTCSRVQLQLRRETDLRISSEYLDVGNGVLQPGPHNIVQGIDTPVGCFDGFVQREEGCLERRQLNQQLHSFQVCLHEKEMVIMTLRTCSGKTGACLQSLSMAQKSVQAMPKLACVSLKAIVTQERTQAAIRRLPDRLLSMRLVLQQRSY